MIKIENIKVFNIEGAIRGMRNPLNSWDKSDSRNVPYSLDENCYTEIFELGKNDLDLMQRLYKAGHPHRKYLRQIMVSMDITAPIYFMSEFDTYKVGVTRNSCSFMHKGLSKPFDITDFSVADDRVYEVLSPLSKKDYKLLYPYETDEYRIFVGENGRSYRVYKNGRVIAEQFEYTDTLGRHRILEEKECTPSKTTSGYFELNLGGRFGAKWQLHRLVATMFLDNPNDLYTVNHLDGNKGNNCVENLEWCDLSDNIKKGFDTGLYDNLKSLHFRYISWKNGHIAVDPFTKVQILYDHNRNKMTCGQLSNKYGISNTTASNIISAKPSEFQELFMLCYTWENIIDCLNDLRNLYLETKDMNVFHQIRCLLPSGYNQKSTITCNYENVVNMLEYRSDHKLDEWQEFCKIMIDKLPYLKEIINGTES